MDDQALTVLLDDLESDRVEGINLILSCRLFSRLPHT